MLGVFDGLHRAATRRPGMVIAAVLLISIMFGWLSSQAITDDAIAVDNEPARALQTLDEQFGDRQSVVQIVVQTDSESIIGRDGLLASMRITQAIRDSEIAATLIGSRSDNAGQGQSAATDGPAMSLQPDAGNDAGPGQQQPAIASFLGGVEVAAAMSGLEASSRCTDRHRRNCRTMSPDCSKLWSKMTRHPRAA